MKCIVVDDEPLAVEIIVRYLSKTEGVELLAQFYNPTLAIKYLEENEVDLVFLDIEMPRISGIDFIKSLCKVPQFIFTTAYPQFALDGFELNAVDYLVKPIPFHRFLKAINKAKEQYSLKQIVNKTNNYIFVRCNYEDIKILINDILYVEGLRDYLKIYRKDIQKPIVTLMSFKQLIKNINDFNFVRVHRSYLINKKHIQSVKRNSLIISKKLIPIGKTYQNLEVINRLK